MTSIYRFAIVNYRFEQGEYKMSLFLTDQEIDIVLFALLKQADALVTEQDSYWYVGNIMRVADIQKTRARLDSAISKIQALAVNSTNAIRSTYV